MMAVSLKSLMYGGRGIAKAVFLRLPSPLRELLWTRTPAERFRERRPLRDMPRVVTELRRRLAEGPGPSIWILPTQTWYSTNFQRPQQMARALSAAGCPVVYGEPWGKQHITPHGRVEAKFHGVKELSPGLHLVKWPTPHLRRLIAQAAPDVILMMWPTQADLLPEQSKSMVVYEMIDDHELVPDADETFRVNHRRWVRDADVLVATADDLLAQLKRLRPDVLLLPNAVLMEDWTKAVDAGVPPDLAAARKAPVVVAYYGTMADWFDWGLWEGAARARPNWSFILIGPPHDRRRIDAVHARVSSHPNMHYLGPKPYESLPAYVAHCDVMAIPFVLNSITHSCSPVKLFEHMAGGKPVVATPMREILKYRSVLFAETPEDFVKQIETGLRQRQDPAYRETLEREARENTWQRRAETLRYAIETARTAQGGLTRRATTAQTS
jgi:hypothetical protein